MPCFLRDVYRELMYDHGGRLWIRGVGGDKRGEEAVWIQINCPSVPTSLSLRVSLDLSTPLSLPFEELSSSGST